MRYDRPALRRVGGAVAASLIVVVAPAGCDNDLDADLIDGERTRAIEIPLDRVVVDNLDTENKDAHDWKFFVVPAEGLVTITVGFDDEGAGPEVQLVNAVGQVLSELELPESSAALRRFSFSAEPGTWYLHMAVAEGDSDYSVEVLWEPGLSAAPGESP